MIIKMRIVAIGMLSSAGYSSLSIVKNTDSSLATQQVMVEVTLMDGERWLSQLRIVTMNGERAHCLNSRFLLKESVGKLDQAYSPRACQRPPVGSARKIYSHG